MERCSRATRRLHFIFMIHTSFVFTCVSDSTLGRVQALLHLQLRQRVEDNNGGRTLATEKNLYIFPKYDLFLSSLQL